MTVLNSNAATARSHILDQLAARYLVTDPASVPFGLADPPTTAGGTTSITTGSSATGEVPGSPLRAALLSVRHSSRLEGALDYVDVTVRDASGNVLARGERRVATSNASSRFFVPIAADTLRPAASDWRVEIALRGAAGDHLDLAATPTGAPAVGVVHPEHDGLSVAFTDAGAVVWRRLNALPRVRWASNAIVQPNETRRLDDLAYGIASKSVVLNEPGPAPSGASAGVRTTRDDDDAVDVAVNARGAGYVVIADALQDGWGATVDGHAATLRPADNALVAVYVPAGRHVIELRARPRGWHLGIAISLASLVVLLALLVAAVISRQRRRTHGQLKSVSDWPT
jgi:hypothetical protein